MGQDWPWNVLWETLEIICDPFQAGMPYLEGLGCFLGNLGTDSPVLGRSSREDSRDVWV